MLEILLQVREYFYLLLGSKVKPIPIRKDPGKSGFNGTFLLGKSACNKRAIKEKPISGIAN